VLKPLIVGGNEGYYLGGFAGFGLTLGRGKALPDSPAAKYLNSLDVKTEMPLLFFWRPASAERQEF
jgi:hypothetical protein